MTMNDHGCVPFVIWMGKKVLNNGLDLIHKLYFADPCMRPMEAICVLKPEYYVIVCLESVF